MGGIDLKVCPAIPHRRPKPEAVDRQAAGTKFESCGARANFTVTIHEHGLGASHFLIFEQRADP